MKSKDMFVGLVDTREHRPERPEREPLWLDLPELRPWRQFAAAIVLFIVSSQLSGWPGLIPFFAGFAFVLHGVTSYYRGNDGMREYRQ
jgi:hypothetical protein